MISGEHLYYTILQIVDQLQILIHYNLNRFGRLKIK